MDLRQSQKYFPWLLLLPVLIIIFFLTLFPLLWSLYLSFTKFSTAKGVDPVFIGIQNYIDIVNNPEIWIRFKTTATITAVCVTLQFFLGLGVALLLNRNIRGSGLLTTVILLPMMTTPVIMGLWWRFMFDRELGVINAIFNTLFNLKIPWISSSQWAIVSVIIVDTWMWMPFVMLVILAGLKAIPHYFYEAAAVDRATRLMKFRYITFPNIRSLILLVLLFRTMDVFKIFDTVFVLTEGGPGSSTETISLFLYREAFSYTNTGFSCALAYLLLIIIIIISNMFMKFLQKPTVTAEEW